MTTTFYKWLIISFLVILPMLAAAQIGVNISRVNSGLTAWYQNADNDYKMQGMAYGIDYWFRLPNRRVEFFPELNYNAAQYEEGNVNEDEGWLVDNKAFAFYFNTHFYLLDFDSDCDCPTWEKDGNFLQKGLYVAVSPGISRHTTSTTFGSVGTISGEKHQSTAYSLGAGIGLDIGITKLLTITPFYRARYFRDIQFSPRLENNGSEFLQTEFGIHLGYRWNDEQTLQRRRRKKRQGW